MFARKVAVRLKPNSLEKFTTLMEQGILPWLRTQEGFLDMILLSSPDSNEVQALSFWDHEANAAAYNSSGYPAVIKSLEGLLDNAPLVKTYEIVSSTMERYARARETTASFAATR